jgi:proteasome accessory factor B
LARLAVIDRAIRAGTWPNATTLGRQLEVTPRTVQRDIEFLRDRLQAPVEFDPRRNGYRYSAADFQLPLVQLTEGELAALFLAERLLQQYRGTPYAAALASLFEKLTASLPSEVTIDLSHLADVYSFRRQGGLDSDARTFTRLARAIRSGRRLELVYWTASRDTTCRRTVDPYHLASIQGDWYLVAYCHLREDLRVFSPGRIRSLRDTGERFERPADFRFGDYLDGAFRVVRGDGPPRQVRLRFTADAARYVRERVWHPSQRLKECRDGGLELTLRVTHFLEVKRWLLSYGAACEVLEPAELRDEVREELQRASKPYGRESESKGVR